MLVECFTGMLLFPAQSEVGHLAFIEKVLGRVPAAMEQEAPLKFQKYFANRREAVDGFSAECRACFEEAEPLRRLLPDESFRDLVTKLLVINPSRRLTAEAALSHSFFEI